MIAQHSIHTGILHNENGVFVPWSFICDHTQQYLLQPCSTLINPDGSLNSQGEKAVGCIRNGFAGAVIGSKYLGLSFDQIKGILNGASGLTGCGGIVNLDQIPNSDMFQMLLSGAGQSAP